MISSAWMPVVASKRAGRVLSAITISSRLALPARSPMPFTVHSTWPAPFWIAASELATPRPRSSWQWTESTARPMFGTRPRTKRMSSPNSEGIAYPTVSGMLIVVAPASIAASTTAQRNSQSERKASSAENSTSRGQGAGVPDRRHRALQDLLAGGVELLLDVDVAGGDEGVDARPGGVTHRVPAAVDVGGDRARQARDHGAPDLAGDVADRLEVALRGHGEARLDDVDAEARELPGQGELLRVVHGEARRLLAVAQRGVEDQDPPAHGRCSPLGWCRWRLVRDAGQTGPAAGGAVEQEHDHRLDRPGEQVEDGQGEERDLRVDGDERDQDDDGDHQVEGAVRLRLELLETAVAHRADHQEGEQVGQQHEEDARGLASAGVHVVEEEDGDGEGPPGHRDGHAGEPALLGRGRLHVEARQAQRAARDEKKGRDPADAREGLELPDVDQQRRGDAEGDEVGERVELHAEAARGAGHPRDLAVEAVHEGGDDDRHRRVLELQVHGRDDRVEAGEEVAGGQQVREDVGALVRRGAEGGFVHWRGPPAGDHVRSAAHAVADAHGRLGGRGQEEVHPGAEADESVALAARDERARRQVADDAPGDEPGDLHEAHVPARRAHGDRGLDVVARGLVFPGGEEFSRAAGHVDDLAGDGGAVDVDVEDREEDADLRAAVGAGDDLDHPAVGGRDQRLRVGGDRPDRVAEKPGDEQREHQRHRGRRPPVQDGEEQRRGRRRGG